MDDEIDESELVEPDSISENEVLYSDGFDQLPPLEIAAEESPGLTAVEASHVYDALPEGYIRLLRILPGEFSNEVRCELHHFALREQPQYSALSYTWGAGPAQHAITLNEKRIHVRKNLWRFLRQARSLGGQLMEMLWIDALCIDQSNLAERAYQVQRMPQIYSIAIKVFVWLGPSYDNSDAVMRALAEPASTWLSKGRLLKVWSKPLGTAIYRFCYRRYWTRLWIFQELLLANQTDLICGNKVVSFERLCNLLSLVMTVDLPTRQRERLEYDRTTNSPASNITYQIIQEPRYSSLVDLLIATRHLQCSEERDKVYALLGVAEGGGTAIVVDYSISFSALMNAVLRKELSLHPPETILDAIEECNRLTERSGLSKQVLFECAGPHGKCPPPPQRHLAAPTLYTNREISLWWAAYHGHDDILRLLLDDTHLDPTYYRDQAIVSGLHTAMEMVLSMKQFKPNMPNQYGHLALHLAAIGGKEEIVRFCLLDDAVNIQARNSNGLTALDLAAKYGRQRVVRLLLNPSNMPVSGVPEYLGRALVSSVEAWKSGYDSGTLAKMLIDTGLIDFSSAEAAIRVAEDTNIPELGEYWWNSVKGNETLLQGFKTDAPGQQAYE